VTLDEQAVAPVLKKFGGDDDCVEGDIQGGKNDHHEPEPETLVLGQKEKRVVHYDHGEEDLRSQEKGGAGQLFDLVNVELGVSTEAKQELAEDEKEVGQDLRDPLREPHANKKGGHQQVQVLEWLEETREEVMDIDPFDHEIKVDAQKGVGFRFARLGGNHENNHQK
jgi:hypothetical protein